MAKAQEHGVEKFALENFSSMLVWNLETLLRLRDAVGPMVGLNLDPSPPDLDGGLIDRLGARAGRGDPPCPRQGCACFERGLVLRQGLLETKAGRRCRLTAPGTMSRSAAGKDTSVVEGVFLPWVRMMGYDDWVSLEMEDLTMSVEAGIKTSIDALKQTISQ